MSLYRKYRPQKFTDVIGQEHVTTTITNQIASEETSHAYLFTGPRGVGKTTMARLIAKVLNCQNSKKNEPCNSCNACQEITGGASLDVIEIDAASHTDVDNVRENIIKNVRFAPNKLKYKVFIIDEVHMLSTSAFNALLKTLEEPPSHAVFVLATTEIHKVPQTIISRCQRFDFRRIQPAVMIKRLKKIAKDEGVEISDDVLQEVVKHSEGCVRDAESLLEQIFALGDKKIGMNEALLVLPSINTVLVEDFIKVLLKKDTPEGIRLLNAYVEQGVEMMHFVDDVISALRDKLIETLQGDQDLDANYLQKAIQTLLEARRHMKTDKIPQLAIELAVVELCQQSDFKNEGVGLVCQTEPPLTPPLKGGEPKLVSPFPRGTTGGSDINDEHTRDAQDLVLSKNTVLGTIPVISLDEVKKKWPEVFEQIKKCNASLPFVVQAGEISNINGDEVEMSFSYQLHADTVNQDKNSRLISQIFKRVTGRALRLKGKYKTTEDDETVSELLDKFGGKVL